MVAHDDHRVMLSLPVELLPRAHDDDVSAKLPDGRLQELVLAGFQEREHADIGHLLLPRMISHSLSIVVVKRLDFAYASLWLRYETLAHHVVRRDPGGHRRGRCDPTGTRRAEPARPSRLSRDRGDGQLPYPRFDPGASLAASPRAPGPPGPSPGPVSSEHQVGTRPDRPTRAPAVESRPRARVVRRPPLRNGAHGGPVPGCARGIPSRLPRGVL